MIFTTIELLHCNSFFKILLVAVALDTVLGVLRAIKYHKFNSAFGIDGAIRKIAMLICIMSLMAIDVIVRIDMMFFVPEQYLQAIGITKLGMCEFFALLFILYEAVSILKNMTLLELPVPARVQSIVRKFLEDMTTEMDDIKVKAGEDKEDERN